MKEIYELRSENLTNLGGPMGTEHTFDNWREHFDSLEKAKKFAKKDYKNEIEWIETPNGFRSDDLGYVMYHIKIIKVK